MSRFIKVHKPDKTYILLNFDHVVHADPLEEGKGSKIYLINGEQLEVTDSLIEINRYAGSRTIIG